MTLALLLALALGSGSTPPPTKRIALAATWCALDDVRQGALKQIAREHRLAKIGGVLDKVRVARSQRVVGHAEDRQAEILAELDGKPPKCDDPEVARASSCVGWDLVHGQVVFGWLQTPECRAPDMAGLRAAWDAL